ncbi:tryptophan dimethylallyltransferase domain-containing protein [Hirsutella rhossiliensis]
MTLGGRLQDKNTLKGLSILRHVWHLLLQKPEPIKDDYDKSINSGSSHKLLFQLRRGGREVLKAFESGFGPVNYHRERAVHCDTSFQYSGEKGIYQTLYFSSSLGEE